MKRFLSRVEKKPPEKFYSLMRTLDREVWDEIDCTSCARCCKTMTPTFTQKDILRISAHLHMTPHAFKKKWLWYDKKDKDWVNVQRPCQFLDMHTNRCTIYAVRPADCAGFPHFKKKTPVEYMHVHQQNIAHCPATYLMVEKMVQKLEMVL
ncbi:MAG: YkgJ family cysteine cluster protein [Chitinophagaceae bacterium]